MLENDKIKLCIICEALDKEVQAKYFVKFNGDLIPVCDRHNKAIRKKNDKEFLDEQ